MLFYPERIEEKLEVDQVREIIAGFCETDAAKKWVDKSQPLNDFTKLSRFLDQTREFIALTNDAENKPGNYFLDIEPFIKKVKTRGAFLIGEDLVMFKKSLKSIYDWTQFLKKNKDNYENLFRLTLGFISDLELVREIESKLDQNGVVKDDASPELRMIRAEILKSEQKVRKVIKSILSNVKKDKFTDEDSEVTIREGRLVIPVKAEHKRQVPGFVHDESSTGQTVFLEPTQVLALNNEVREWYYQEKREVQKILLELSDLIRESINDLQKGAAFLILIDFLNAKARFATEFNASVPILTKTPQIDLKNAFHPILWKINRELKKKVIPLSLHLDHNQNRIVVISGPNAGGKSVAMKTVGILQYCFQCGFPVTCDENSVLGIFSNFFIDIGDSQSLESDLSTYSSRLQAMNYFTRFSDKRTLVFIDEFGTGTEPRYGGAIAESALEVIHKSNSYGVITTHYGNIKEYAEKATGILNASMKFDADQLEPLYQLDIGKPGSSFAMEMAMKNGLSEKVLKRAKELVGIEQVSYDKMLADIQAEKIKLERKTRSIENKENELNELRTDYERLREMIRQEEKKILKNAKTEAKQLLIEANAKIENSIRLIKEKNAEKEKTRKIREELKTFEESLKVEDKPIKRREPKKVKKIEGNIEKDDQVRLRNSDSVGYVLSVKGKKAEVSFGQLKSFVEIERLEKISNTQAKKISRSKSSLGLNLNDKMTSFSSELDVRGKRVEEVLPILDRFINDATILGQNNLRILHGKGHGILREIIRNHLSSEPNVQSYQDEHVDRGGSGITLVTLN